MRFFYYIFLTASGILLFTTCQNDDIKPTGRIELSIIENSNANGRVSSVNAHSLIVSVNTIDGAAVLSREQIELHNFSGNYISQPIALEVGEYILTEFFVLNESGDVIYATPIAESELEHFVSTPLPLEFDILEDKTNKLELEVIATEFASALDFGYTTINFSITNTFGINLSVFEYNELLENFELTDAQLIIKTGSDTLLIKELLNLTNRVLLKTDVENYEIIVKKDDFSTYKRLASVDYLKMFQDSVLIINLFGDVDLESNLVAKYTFEGVTEDLSGNNLHGQPMGDASFAADRFGMANHSLDLDGSYDYVVVQDNDLLDIGNAEDASYTISFWYNSLGDNNQFVNWIIGKGITQTSESTDYSFGIHNDPNFTGETKLIYTVGPSTDECALSLIDLPSQASWHHVVLTLSAYTTNTGLKNAFIDGELVLSCEYGEKVGARTEELLIGAGKRPDGGVERFFYGQIDDIQIFRRVLSNTDIKALYYQ